VTEGAPPLEDLGKPRWFAPAGFLFGWGTGPCACPHFGFNDAANAKRVLVLRQAQDEDEFDGGSVEILILSLSKDEDFSRRRGSQHTQGFPTGAAVAHGSG
jgi:hypothetical protein